MFPSFARLCRAGACAFATWAACLYCPPAASAAVPATNDVCATATVIPAAGPFPFWTAVTDISGATTNGDPVIPSMNDCLGLQEAMHSHSVWFKFAPSVSAFYTLSVGEDTATEFGGNIDTIMAVYTSSTGTCGGTLTPYACNDDSGFNASAIATNLSVGTTYFVV